VPGVGSASGKVRQVVKGKDYDVLYQVGAASIRLMAVTLAELKTHPRNAAVRNVAGKPSVRPLLVVAGATLEEQL